MGKEGNNGGRKGSTKREGIRGSDYKQSTGIERNCERGKGRTRRGNQNEGEHTVDNYNSKCEWDELSHKTEANSRVD